jgi:hypothetical protein
VSLREGRFTYHVITAIRNTFASVLDFIMKCTFVMSPETICLPAMVALYRYEDFSKFSMIVESSSFC